MRFYGRKNRLRLKISNKFLDPSLRICKEFQNFDFEGYRLAIFLVLKIYFPYQHLFKCSFLSKSDVQNGERNHEMVYSVPLLLTAKCNC